MKHLLLYILIAFSSSAYAQGVIDRDAAEWLKNNEDIQSMVDLVQRKGPVKMSDHMFLVDARVSGDLFAIHYEFQMTESEMALLLEQQGISFQEFKSGGEERTVADLCSLDFTMDILKNNGRVTGAFSYKSGPIAYMAEVSDESDCG